jgi:glycosyltransferase involved in cell wall biosynthesis
MWFGVPVVAYSVCSIPELLGPSGIRLSDKNPAVIATVLREIFESPRLRESIVGAQRERLPAYSPERVGAALRAMLAPFL